MKLALRTLGLIFQKKSTTDARDENILRETVILVGLVQNGRSWVKDDGLGDQTGRSKRLKVDSPKDLNRTFYESGRSLNQNVDDPITNILTA